MNKTMFYVFIAALALMLCGCQATEPAASSSASKTTSSPTVSGSNTQLMTQRQFTEKMLELLRSKDGDTNFVIQDDETIIIENEEGGDNPEIYLGNAYISYTEYPEDEQEILDYYAESMLEAMTGDTAELTRESIRITIKPQDYVDEVRALGHEPVIEEFLPGLYIFYMMDNPKTARAINADELATADIAKSELRTIGIANTKREVLPYLELGESDGLHYFVADGMYDSALIFCDVVQELEVEGDYIVGIPKRDMVLIADSADAAAVKDLATVTAGMYADAAYPITDKLLRWTGDRYEYYDE